MAPHNFADSAVGPTAPLLDAIDVSAADHDPPRQIRLIWPPISGSGRGPGGLTPESGPYHMDQFSGVRSPLQVRPVCGALVDEQGRPLFGGQTWLKCRSSVQVLLDS